MYFLIFATDNEAGERIMDGCFDRVRLRVHRGARPRDAVCLPAPTEASSGGLVRGRQPVQPRRRQLLPFRPVEHPSAGLRGPTAPLLEEERDASLAQRSRRSLTHSASHRPMPGRTRRRLSASRCRRGRALERPEQWLGRDEANGRRDLAEIVGTVTKRRFSMLRPSTRSACHGRRGASSASRSWRLVRTWKVCRVASPITSKTSPM